jgi:hypothetical protein
MLTVYYLVAVICGFFAYREFKFQMQEKYVNAAPQGEAARAEFEASQQNGQNAA